MTNEARGEEYLGVLGLDLVKGTAFHGANTQEKRRHNDRRGYSLVDDNLGGYGLG